MDRIIGIFIAPPLAVARLGSSETPVESFDWIQDATAADGNLTIIKPSLTFEIMPNGSIRPYLPNRIVFKDPGNHIRPVAPFFELWATMQSARTGESYEQPITSKLLSEYGVGLDAVHYSFTGANRKAESRTGAAETSFIARVEADGCNYERQELLAISPHSADQEPLVFADKPISLGFFQVIRPTPDRHGVGSNAEGADLDVLRVRFTPAKGKVYGPPGAIAGPASPLQPGEAAPAQSLSGRIHEIVPPENRFLNPESEWSKFAMDTPPWQPNSPIDAYDGANVGTYRSWGVVDDTCDAMLEAALVINGERFQALARAFVGPPSFAPDRRPFYAVSDDLADRELPESTVTRATLNENIDEVTDLFARIFETASTINLDAHRSWALTVNAGKVGAPTPNTPGWDDNTDPKIGPASMTAKDSPYVDVVPVLAPNQPESMFNSWNKVDRLPYKQVVDFVHAPLLERKVLLSFLRRRADHMKELIRKPLGTVETLPSRPGVDMPGDYRDPRDIRSRLYDMKMPPYMRHSMGYPLTVTIRQYEQLMALIKLLGELPDSVTEETDQTDQEG